MSLGQCGVCGSLSVRHSSSVFLHAARWFMRSRKRYCIDCGKKWRVDGVSLAMLFQRGDSVVFLVVLVGLCSFLITGIDHPKEWLENQVRGYYDAKYGADAKRKIHEDFGVLFGSKKKAMAKYAGAGKR